MNPPGIPSHYVEWSPGQWCHPSRVKGFVEARKLLPNVSESVRRLNPHLYAKTTNSLGELLSTKPQSDPLPALVKKPHGSNSGTKRVAVRVTIVRCSSGSLDDDNLASSYKGLRDSIARSLGIDDADPRVKWEYGQVESRASRGTIVKIERL